MPIEDLLATLPEELLSENAAPLTPCSVNDEGDNDEDNDKGTVLSLVPGAYEPPKAVKEHETCTTCRVPSQSKFIAKYCPYKESEILLFEAVYVLRVTTKQQWQRIS